MNAARAVSLAALVAGATVSGFAQSKAPQNSDPHPDFQGTYEFVTLTPLQRPKEFEGKPFLTVAEAAEYVKRRTEGANADRRSSNALADLLGSYNEFWYERGSDLLKVRGRYLTSRIIDPPDGRIPALTPAARQRVAASVNVPGTQPPLDGPESLGLAARCLSPSPVISPGGEANLLRIVQTPNHLAIQTELMNVVRVISLTSVTHLPSSLRSRTGHSNGRWEHETLVVDTTNIRGPFGFDYAAVDDNLRLTERFSRESERDILYEATVDDPTAYSRPWTMQLVLRRTDARMFEFACHEGNYSLRNTLQGARARDERVTKP